MKCAICGEKIEGEEDQDNSMFCNRSGYDGKSAHEACYNDDQNEPEATIKHYIDGEIETSFIFGYSYFNENDRDVINELEQNLQWIQTDGWRGHFEINAPSGFVEVVDSWFCGMDGHNLNKENYTEQLQTKVDNGDLPPFEMIIVFTRTSNVFATGINVYVQNKDQFIDWINKT